MGVGGQRHASAALLPGKTQFPLYRRLGWPQGRSGQVWKILPPLEFDPRTVQPVASRHADCSPKILKSCEQVASKVTKYLTTQLLKAATKFVLVPVLLVCLFQLQLQQVPVLRHNGETSFSSSY
jgi:hypothetical protein